MGSEALEQPRYVCAIGAQQTVLAIPRAIPIVHAGPGCSSKISGALGDQAGFQGAGYAGGSAVPSTNFGESEVVFGGEQKLRSTIDGTLKVMDGDLFVVLTGCTSDIVGDDVASIATEYRQSGFPVVNAETGGFKGNNYLGHELVMLAIIEQLLGNGQKSAVDPGLVNVFSVIPCQDAFWRGDLRTIKTLLERLGLRANILFGYDSAGLEEWRNIPSARFNLVLSPWVGLETARTLETKYGTPFLHWPALPVGAVETSRFLRAIGDFAQVDPRIVKSAIGDEEKIFYGYLGSAADFLTEARNGLPLLFHAVADSAYALALSRFLVNEMGFSPGLIFATENPPESERCQVSRQFEDLAGDFGPMIFENDGGLIQDRLDQALDDERGALILASSWEKDLAARHDGHLLRVSLPIYDRLIMGRSYLGYGGGLRLLEDIYNLVLGKSA
jgi:nitrogenase molybdenum-iron protein beta chain